MKIGEIAEKVEFKLPLGAAVAVIAAMILGFAGFLMTLTMMGMGPEAITLFWAIFWFTFWVIIALIIVVVVIAIIVLLLMAL